MPGSEPRLAGPQRPAVHLADVAAGHAERGVVGADGPRWSRPTSCGISVHPSSIWAAWTCRHPGRLGACLVATTMNYVHVPATHIEDAWIAGQQRAADRLRGLSR